MSNFFYLSLSLLFLFPFFLTIFRNLLLVCVFMTWSIFPEAFFLPSLKVWLRALCVTFEWPVKNPFFPSSRSQQQKPGSILVQQFSLPTKKSFPNVHLQP